MNRLAVRPFETLNRLAVRPFMIVSLAALFLLGGTISARALPVSTPTAPSLGSAASFAVLGGSTVTNTGDTIIVGNLGVSPGSAVTGFPPGIVNSGSIHAADAVAAGAQANVTTAYNALVAMKCGSDLTGKDLGGMSLTPGIYCFSSSAQLTGTLTLTSDDGLYVFQIGSMLTTASNSKVVARMGSAVCDACANVFWQVGSSATLGTGTAFEGNILALTSITLTTGATVSGRALARNGAVTMDTNVVSACGSGGGSPSGSINVTGGGGISVTGGDANFGFVAQRKSTGAVSGDFNYVNHVTGLHVNGKVTNIAVIAVYPDGPAGHPSMASPKTVAFSGTSSGVPASSFYVMVEDRGEPGTNDQFGVTVTGGLSEVESQRVIDHGNIVQTLLVLSASADVTTGTTPLVVSFESNTPGGIAPFSYYWKFGDGATSTAQNPSHTFGVAGNYSVTLKVVDAIGQSAMKTFTISVNRPSLLGSGIGVSAGLIYYLAVGVGTGTAAVLVWRRRKSSSEPPENLEEPPTPENPPRT